MNYRFGSFEIDLDRQELRRAGETQRVEPQVFDLLVHLVRHRDRIVSKDELIETIWHGRIVSEAALSSRINAARRALGDNGNDQVFIRTLHKRGFRFVGEVKDHAIAQAEQEARQAPAPAPSGSLSIGAGAFVASANAAAEVATVDSPPAVPGTDTLRASIAVLPFDNLSGDSDNEYFSYGMTEDIIRLLARNRWLTVISRHSTVGFRARAVDVRMVGDALGVRYVLVGSVRKNREAVRITCELVRAADGTQLWAENYDVSLEDIFGIQEEMARQISATIEPELSRVEQQLAARKSPDNLDAWDCYQRGLWHLWAFTTPGFDRAEEFFGRAIEIDPEFARAHGALGYVNVQRALYDVPAARAVRLDTALQLGRTAVALDERDCFTHCVVGRALSLLRRNAEASDALELAIELNPSFAQGYFAQGFNLLWAGREMEAEALLDRATMLSPRDSHLWSFHHVRAWAHFSLGELDMAADFARRATRQPNVTYRAFATLAASLGNLGGGAEAEAAASELLQRKPEYTGAFARQEFFFCNNESFVDRFVTGLRVAGLPEG